MPEQQTDVDLIRSAMPALLRMAQATDRLAYLEETNKFDAIVGRVYQQTVNDLCNGLRANPGWKSPEADPNAVSRTDKLWRLTELMREIYPEAIAIVDLATNSVT